uniref:Fucolectin tachylectin-4 pentraxin-1 domain-containing protein n=1 Tax=Strigamia maritima TaxID=126957 RepID=T1JKV9_STRMM
MSDSSARSTAISGVSTGNKKLKYMCIVVLLLVCCLVSVVFFLGIGYAVSKKPKPTSRCDQTFSGLDFSSKQANQSSTYETSEFNVNWAQDLDLKTCTHTNLFEDDKLDIFPWWQLDLVDKYVITNVSLHTRPDCCWDLNHDLQVRVGSFQEVEKGIIFHRNGMCDEFPGGKYAKGMVFNFICPPYRIGRFISVQKVVYCSKCSDVSLSICELIFQGYLFIK